MTGPKQKNSSAVLVFLKYPQSGRVKTRLARTVGNDKACEIYLELLHQVFARVGQLPKSQFQVYAVYDPTHSVAEYRTLLKAYDVEFIPQKGEGLGERLHEAFLHTLPHHQGAMAIGTDCVTISKETFQSAHGFLIDDKNCVVGPSEDGGYYLIGMSKLYAELFRGINWSTSTVFKETLERISGLSLKAQILNQLTDIDTESDYQNYLLR